MIVVPTGLADYYCWILLLSLLFLPAAHSSSAMKTRT